LSASRTDNSFRNPDKCSSMFSECFEPNGDLNIASIIARIFGNAFVLSVPSIRSRLMILGSDRESIFTLSLFLEVTISARNRSITPQPELFLSIETTER